MTTISTLASITTAPSYATAALPASANANANTTNGTATSAGAPSTSPAAPSPSTSVTLSTLSTEAGIVATLNGAGSAYPTYDATGLLNMVAQAGMAAAGSAGNAATATTAPGGVAADWGSLLKSNPGMTAVAVGYAMTQDIVNTFSTAA